MTAPVLLADLDARCPSCGGRLAVLDVDGPADADEHPGPAVVVLAGCLRAYCRDGETVVRVVVP
jgi:hypothetical protein